MRETKRPEVDHAEPSDEAPQTFKSTQSLGIIVIFLGFGGLVVLLILTELLRKVYAG